MRARNPAHSRKSKPGAASPRGEEGVEDAGEIFFTNAASIVRYFDYRFIFKFFGALIFRSRDLNLNRTLITNRLNGVDNQIEHGVFNLSWIDGYGYWIYGG